MIASGATIIATGANAQITEPRETIAYDGAKQIVETCMTMAAAKHWPIAIWVLDISGQPVYFASRGASEVGVTTAKRASVPSLPVCLSRSSTSRGAL